MDDLSSIFGPQDKGKDLVDKLVVLLDRQTDHKLTPHVLLGFLGLFNVLSIMSVVQGNLDGGIKEVAAPAEAGDTGANGQSLMDTLSGLMNNQGNGQPDLMGLLSNLASKKKINPTLLLSLLSMMNPQGGSPAAPQQNSPAAEVAGSEQSRPNEDSAEKKTPDDKQGVELRYDRRRGAGERG